MNQTQQSQLQYQEQAQDQNQPQNENENVNEQQNEEEEVKEEEEEEEEEDGDQDWQDQPNDAKPPNVPTRPCMISSCSGHVTKPYLCASCKTTFACCSIECYMNIIVHRDLTSHYMTCRSVELSHLQEKLHGLRDNKYTWYYTQPCRRCAKFDKHSGRPSGVVCEHCLTKYCGTECMNKDKKRHEAKKGECVERITKQLPLKTQAPSVGSSILVPDLLTHTLSFLSLYQWSLAGRVNHAWRNATLQPSAFPHAVVTSIRLDSPRIGPLHRACLRAFECISRPRSEEVLFDYPHLRSFQSAIAGRQETADTNYIGQLLRLPTALTSLHLEARVTVKATVEALARFNKLCKLTLNLPYGSLALGIFGSTLQQLTELQRLSLHLIRVKKADGEKLSWGKQDRQDKADRIAIKAIVDTAATHLHSLESLTLDSPSCSIIRHITLAMPHVRRFDLFEAHFHPHSPEDELKVLTTLINYLPGVTDLRIACHFTRGMEYDAWLPKLQLLRDSLITSINAFGPQLKALKFEWSPRIQGGGDSEDEHDDFGDGHKFHGLKPEELTRLLTHCTGVEELSFCYYHAVMRTPSDIDIMTKLTPAVRSLHVDLQGANPYGLGSDQRKTHRVEGDFSTENLTRMIESLPTRFTHLTSLHFHSPAIEIEETYLKFDPPSAQFLAQQDSLPRLKHVLLVGFDVETRLSGLLRLLPKIDSLVLQGVNLTAERFFEYVQYRPLAFTKQSNRYEQLTIPRVQTMEEDDLQWFDFESELVHVDSILAPSSLPAYLHSLYHRGVRLSKQKQPPSSSHSHSDEPEDDDQNDDSNNRERRGGRGGGRGGRGRGRGGYTPSKREMKSAAGISHGWMFSHVRNWTWNWCEINISSEHEANEDDDTSSLIAHLPDGIAYHRSQMWIYTHAADVKRNPDFKLLSKRFGRFAKERKCGPPIANSSFE